MNLRKYKNEGNMNINYIRYAQEVFPHCEIGKENYKGKIEVGFAKPDGTLYTETFKWDELQHSIKG